MATVGANRRSFDNLKTFRTTPNRKVPFRIDRRTLPKGLVEIPLHIGVKQRIPRVIAYAIDDFGHLPRLVPHGSHALLPVQRMAFRGPQKNAAADLVDGDTLADNSDIAEDGYSSVSKILQDLFSPSWRSSSR